PLPVRRQWTAIALGQGYGGGTVSPSDVAHSVYPPRLLLEEHEDLPVRRKIAGDGRVEPPIAVVALVSRKSPKDLPLLVSPLEENASLARHIVEHEVPRKGRERPLPTREGHGGKVRRTVGDAREPDFRTVGRPCEILRVLDEHRPRLLQVHDFEPPLVFEGDAISSRRNPDADPGGFAERGSERQLQYSFLTSGLTRDRK